MLALLLMAQATTAQLPLPAFLAGCWEQRNGDRWTEECWTAPRGGLMIGSGRDGTGERINHWEYMRIERADDGSLSFYGSPKGATPVAFKATQVNESEIVFANPTHDFPQRIRYLRTAAGIDAEISLTNGTKPVRWSYRRSGSPTGN
ncbi:MAG TPA: DUF6265 family protein [Sphingomicrobium sp.]|nr:DUF6265 family protein [Sphingomicrobium sp.]